MGLRDRMIAAYADRDFAGELRAALGPDDRMLGFATGRAASYEHAGPRRRSDLTTLLVGGLQEELAKARHVVGEKGSTARSIPRDARNSGTLVLSESGLSVWRLATGATATAPTCTLRLPRTEIASLRRRQGRARRGFDLLRVEFRDCSCFDYLVLAHESSAAFWTAALAISPA